MVSKMSLWCPTTSRIGSPVDTGRHRRGIPQSCGSKTSESPKKTDNAVSKKYVLAHDGIQDSLCVLKSGDTIGGDLAMGENLVTGLGSLKWRCDDRRPVVH